jgi:uncharacterized RDD family membrane protein YckC
MTWYYADAGRQVGPIEESALDDLVRAGVVRDDTLVWRDGMPSWQPHGMARGVRQPVPMPAVPVPAVPMQAGSGFCAECGRPFPLNQLVTIGNATVCAQCKPFYLQRIREGGQAIGAHRYAGFWIRFVAYIIDTVILTVALSVISVPVGLLIGGSAAFSDPTHLSGFMLLITLGYLLVTVGLTFFYQAYFVSKRGGTPGKLILGLRVIHPDGSLLTMGQAFGRSLGYMVDVVILYIGFLMIAFDEQKRGLHDRIVDSRVIYAR